MAIRAAGNVARAAARLKILAAQARERAVARHSSDLEGFEGVLSSQDGGLGAPLLHPATLDSEQGGGTNGRVTSESMAGSLIALPEDGPLSQAIIGSPPHSFQHTATPGSAQKRTFMTQTSVGGRSDMTARTDNSFISNPRISSGASEGGYLQRNVVRHHELCESIAAHDASLLPEWRRDLLALKEMLVGSWINLLLVCLPLGCASALLHWGAVPTFVLNFLALVPLALILGDITEDLAVRFGDTVGGLINATFGNVVEMILSVAALLKGLYAVVAMSLLGSILSNLLLVLGCCFFFGGLKHKVQSFNAAANQATSSLLFLSCIGIIIPTTATMLADDEDMRGESWTLEVSRFTAVVLLGIYLCYLVFQLGTHSELFQGEEDEGEPVMTLVGAFLSLTAITLAVAVCSEFLTGSIEEFSVHTGLSQAFVGMIILPIAGNACEHITAIVVAVKNKMDLALGVAVGSSIQIATFVIPFVVLVGWATGHPFTLHFDPFSTLALTVAVIHANIVMGGAQSHWLMGVELAATYIIIAGAFLF